MMELSTCNLLTISIGCVSLYALFKLIASRRKTSMIDKWTKDSKNKVILHGMYGGKVLPSASPFVLKLETYLRMAKIDYELDKSDIWGPKGKTPWISINGQHVSDSQFIVEFLAKKYDNRFDTVYNDGQRAEATAVRIMMEEYVYWAAILWRFKFGGRDTFAKVRSGEITFGEWMIFKMIAPSLTSMAWTQGIGRHSEEEVLQIMENCLRALSNVLRNKPFLLGEQPCETDCAIFGQLASCVFSQNSPFENLLNGEMRNLKQYCVRMKEEFWPDWNELLSNA